MKPEEKLYHAIGELAYAIARADGYIQKEEHRSFTDIVTGALRSNKHQINIPEMINKILEKDKFVNTKTSFETVLKEIRLSSKYLSPELKLMFFKVIDKVSAAYPPMTKQNISLIEKMRLDIGAIEGDPSHYQNIIN